MIVVGGARVAATAILRNPARYGAAAVNAAKQALAKVAGAGGLGGLARDVGGTIAAGTVWEMGQDAYGWIVDTVTGGGGEAGGGGNEVIDGEFEADMDYEDGGGEGPSLDDLIGTGGGGGDIGGGAYHDPSGMVPFGGGGVDGASVVIQGPTVANQKFALVPTITREAEDWLRDNLTARGWSREQVADPYLLAACMVAQGMCPPPAEVMVPLRARDWLSSTGFGDGSTSLAHSRKDSGFEYACKYGLRVALAVRLGLAYVDRYSARKKTTTRRKSSTTTTTTTRKRPAATVKTTTTRRRK